MRHTRYISIIGAILVGLLLVGCSSSPTRKFNNISDEKLAEYYANVKLNYLSQGYLKDEEESDAVYFNAEMLAKNFEDIALYNEYVVEKGNYVASAKPSKVKKWRQPIRIRLIHGPSVPNERRLMDYQLISAYTDRLESLTGHPIEISGSNPNFYILIMSNTEYRNSARLLRNEIQKLPRSVERAITESSPEILCSAFTLLRNSRSSEFVRAIIMLKDEHRDIMRESCVHEEIAQAMGLVNDSFLARPSIFNDDEEFALLTRHDELLLQILYDSRIKIGMSIREARPVIREIARELVTD